MKRIIPGPVVLCILDGWGIAPDHSHNAIFKAKTPVWDSLLKEYPCSELLTSGVAVGLPDGQMGNSEVGHMNIGSGRVTVQDLPRIEDAIATDMLGHNSDVQKFIDAMLLSGGTCHLMGLISTGGVHSHQNHMVALSKILSRNGIPVSIHAFLDGRDTAPRSALSYVEKFEAEIEILEEVKIRTLCGRYYAMDRDNRWDRVSKAWNLIVNGKGNTSNNTGAIDAIKNSYNKNISDEFLEPVSIGNFPGVLDGDGLISANFRADRVREILSSLIDPNFDKFSRNCVPKFNSVLGMCSYSENLDRYMDYIFPPIIMSNVLGEVLSVSGLKQLRLAETEKYAHVTFFLNGGREAVFEGEERILVASPQVPTYDLKPEMSALELTDHLLSAVEESRFDFIAINYANTDMVGHTGNLDAACLAVETVDACLGKLVKAVTDADGALLITADHGNVEDMLSISGEPQTAHTRNPVPSIMVSNYKKKFSKMRKGALLDIAPTILYLLGLRQPKEMTGNSLIDV